MKLEDIKAGMTYRGKSGPDRMVMGIAGGEITYVQQTGKPAAPRSCWCTTFLEWARSVVSPEATGGD